MSDTQSAAPLNDDGWDDWRREEVDNLHASLMEAASKETDIDRSILLHQAADMILNLADLADDAEDDNLDDELLNAALKQKVGHGDRELRMLCLQIAFQATANPESGLSHARKYYDWVTGRRDLIGEVKGEAGPVASTDPTYEEYRANLERQVRGYEAFLRSKDVPNNFTPFRWAPGAASSTSSGCGVPVEAAANAYDEDGRAIHWDPRV